MAHGPALNYDFIGMKQLGDKTVTSLLWFNTFNTKKTYNESMSSSKGMAAVTTRVFAGIMLIPIKLLSLPLSPPPPPPPPLPPPPPPPPPPPLSPPSLFPSLSPPLSLPPLSPPLSLSLSISLTVKINLNCQYLLLK